MPDYGLDLDAWKILLRCSTSRAYFHPAFALSCIRAIWRALLAMRAKNMIHGDLKRDNIAIPLMPGSLRLSEDRGSVKFCLDVDQTRLIDLGCALSADIGARRTLVINGKYVNCPRGPYVSPRMEAAYRAADPNGRLCDTKLLMNLDWRVDIYSLAVLVEAWTAAIESDNPRNNTATLKTLATTFREMHDDSAAANEQAGKIIPLIDNVLLGANEWQKVNVEIDLLKLADLDTTLAREYADLISPLPVAEANATIPPVETTTTPPESPRTSKGSLLGGTLGAMALAGAAAIYFSPQAPAPEIKIPMVEPPSPPLAETYRDRSAKIKNSDWWLSATPPPAGTAEQAWLQETRDLAAKNDMAAQLNLGMAGLAKHVNGMRKRDALASLVSGLMLVDAKALAGADARLVRDGACLTTQYAIFDPDASLAQYSLPAFAHLASLKKHDAALTAGHIMACRVTPADLDKAAGHYRLAAASSDPAVREAANAALAGLRAGAPECYFPNEQIKPC